MEEPINDPKECTACMEEIRVKTENVLGEIRHEAKVHRAKMADEWAGFIVRSETTLQEDLTRNEKSNDKLSSNAKWILSIVLLTTFTVGVGFGMMWNDVADLKNNKADRGEVMLLKEAQAIHEIRDAYYKDYFIHNPSAKIDSANYNWIIKSIFEGTLRGGEVKK